LGGVILMLSPLQPGGAPFIAVALVGAILSAGMVLSIRGIDPDEPIATVLTYQFLPVMPILAVPTILFWTKPAPEQWFLLVVIGVSATIGQWLLILAFQRAGAAKLAPLDFVRLILMTGCGLAFFGETVSVTLGLGMLVVVLTTVYSVRANARSKSVA
jgi:drug/metabolite transporter (DMT)-like permease